MEGEGEEQNRRELHLPLSEEREGRRTAFSPPSPSSQRSSALRLPVGGHLLSAGGRLAPPGQSVFGKTQLWTNGVDGGGETDNVSRHRDTGCDGLKTFFPSAPALCPRSPLQGWEYFLDVGRIT